MIADKIVMLAVAVLQSWEIEAPSSRLCDPIAKSNLPHVLRGRRASFLPTSSNNQLSLSTDISSATAFSLASK